MLVFEATGEAIDKAMGEAMGVEERDMRGVVRLTTAVLSLIVLGAVFLDYWGYSRSFHLEPGLWLDVVRGTAAAPNQYRIAVIDTAYFLSQHLHMGLRHAVTLIDLIAGLVCVLTLFFLLRQTRVYREASEAGRWFGAAAFVVLVQYYLAWLLWYQRPETLTTGAILALALLLLSGGGEHRTAGAMAARAAGLLALTVLQGLVRADIALSLHVGILLVCLTTDGDGFALPRGAQAAVSAAGVAVAGAIQYYLMHRAFPQATYGDTPVLQLLINLKTPAEWVPFLLFTAPFLWTLKSVATKQAWGEAPGKSMLAGATVFLGMWFVAGRIEEVRIFLPYALALTPLTTCVAMQRVSGGATRRAEQATG